MSRVVPVREDALNATHEQKGGGWERAVLSAGRGRSPSGRNREVKEVEGPSRTVQNLNEHQ